MPGAANDRTIGGEAIHVAAGMDAMAFADLLREPLAASRALLELLAGAECPDPGMIGGYLGPALRELGRACELLEDLHVLTNAEHAVGQSDDLVAIEVQDLVGTAGLETFRRGEMLPPPEIDASDPDGTPLMIRGHRRTLDRMLRAAIEFTAETAMPNATEPVPMDVRRAMDPELGPVIRLALGRQDGRVAAAATVADTGRDAHDIDEDDGLGPGPDDGTTDFATSEAHRFRRSVLEAIAHAHGGRVVFGEAAAPAAMHIDLPRGETAAEWPREERAA